MKTKRADLTDLQREAAAQLMELHSKKAVAFKLGIGYRTLQRWYADRRFRDYLHQLYDLGGWREKAASELDMVHERITLAMKGELNPATPEYREARRRVGAFNRGPVFRGKLLDGEGRQVRLDYLYLIDSAVAYVWDRPLPEYDDFIRKRTSHKPGPGRFPDW